MKCIVAFIKPNMLDDVIFALHEIEGFPGASISEVQRIGSGSREHSQHSDHTPFHGFPKSVRMEIVCPASRVEEILETIREKAHTGLPDNGKVYVSPVEDALRIQTGDRGDAAVW
ncbi:MAG: P-II family nitrogen regulator [Verrucomicrobia bacterium]|nr:P-II family nitrogen regulator [Verrucomicrobiota bacterium]MDA1085708.1 P-II family nitrogen regulator [Verrucomicrobiota bacterium]